MSEQPTQGDTTVNAGEANVTIEAPSADSGSQSQDGGQGGQEGGQDGGSGLVAEDTSVEQGSGS